jgi:M6 family metalloprotease-like protein
MTRLKLFSWGYPAAVCALSFILADVSLHAQGLSAAAERMRSLNNQIVSNVTGTARTDAAEVIEQRAAALNELIEHQPAQALELALSPEILADLVAEFPDSVSQLESHGKWRGTIEKAVYDSADLRSSRSVTRMKIGEQTFELHFAGREPKGLKSGDILSGSGISLANSMAVASCTIQAAASSIQMCSTKGAQNTAVLLVTFPGVTLPATVTPQTLSDIFFGTSTGVSMDGFLREASYGQTSATGTVFGPYTLTGSYTSCSDVGTAVLNDAIAAAIASGVNLNNYTRVFLAFPDIFGCGWAGFVPFGCSIASSSGAFNASIAYVVTSYMTSRAPGVALVSHEMGHDFGLLHSGVITAGTDVLGPTSSPGTEYDQNGDYWSAMGEMVLGQYPAPQKAEVLDWMAANTNYETVQSSGTYTLQPLETNPPGLQALKIQRGTGNNQWLWIEYRQAIGNYDSTLLSQPYSGALMHYEDSSTALGHTYMPNFTPADTTWNSPALAAGQNWTDPYTNLSISVLSATATALTVNVNYGAIPCVHANPKVTMSPANPSVSAGSNVNYTVALTNNDTSTCVASTFALSSIQPSGWLGTFSAGSLTLNPGQTASAALTQAVPMTALPGAYTVSASAADGSYVASAAASATVAALSVSIAISGSSFTAHQTIPTTATVLYGGAAVPGGTVTFTMTKPGGSSITGTAMTDSTGKAAWSYKVAPKDPLGTYSVVAKASSNGHTAISNTALFSVQ